MGDRIKRPNSADKNLAELDLEQFGLCERRLAHIREKARILADGVSFAEPFFLSDSFRRSYNEAKRNIAEAAPDTPKINLVETKRAATYLRNSERAYLCKVLTEYFLSGTAKKFSAENFFTSPTPESKATKISYLKNALSDIAYREFSKVLPYPTVTYSHDFQTVCEDVYYGRADCCILPVENTSDGRLMRFRSLADKYELAIFLTCTVAAESGEVTKFALLRKEIAKSNIKSIFKDGDFFEFYTVISGDVSISDILITAQYFGLFPYKIDSTPISYTERAYSYDIVLKTDGGDLVSFLCYLFLEAPQFSPVGLYSQLKGN